MIFTIINHTDQEYAILINDELEGWNKVNNFRGDVNKIIIDYAILIKNWDPNILVSIISDINPTLYFYREGHVLDSHDETLKN